MGACYFSLRDYPTAKATLEQALGQVTANETPDALATLCESLAQCCEKLGLVEETVGYY